jgi:hypothetical protein
LNQVIHFGSMIHVHDSITDGTRQAALIGALRRLLGQRRRDHQRLQHLPGLDPLDGRSTRIGRLFEPNGGVG